MTAMLSELTGKEVRGSAVIYCNFLVPAELFIVTEPDYGHFL
ncbi:hypothetical protein AAD001_06325 [Colwelliaceae bacterium 6471]